MFELPAEYSLYAKALVGMLAIVDPLGAVPVFLSLTEERSFYGCRQVARRTALSVAIVLIASIWIGDLILNFFGMGIPAFRTGGGLLILLMAIAMMHAKRSTSRQTQAKADEADQKEDVAVVPLAIPLLAGPGAISLVIVDAHQVDGGSGRFILSAAVVIVAVAVWLALRLAAPIGERLGITGLNQVRLLGLQISGGEGGMDSRLPAAHPCGALSRPNWLSCQFVEPSCRVQIPPAGLRHA